MFERIMSYGFMQGPQRFLKAHCALDSKSTWYDFLNRFIDKVADPLTSERAASVSYSLILAVFPGIIFLFTLISFIPIPNLEAQIMDFLRGALPETTYEIVKHTIYDIISHQRRDILSFGLMLALYASTSGMVSLISTFNLTDRVREERSFIKTRLIALLLTLMLIFALLLAVVVVVVGGVLIDYLVQFGIFDNVFFLYLSAILRYAVVFTVFVLAIAVIYKIGPAVNMKWRFITPGCLVASVLLVLTTYGFSFYISNFTSYNKLYGSIGTLIVLMIWIDLVVLLLIIGFEMNVSLYNLEGKKTLQLVEKKQ